MFLFISITRLAPPRFLQHLLLLSGASMPHTYPEALDNAQAGIVTTKTVAMIMARPTLYTCKEVNKSLNMTIGPSFRQLFSQ